MKPALPADVYITFMRGTSELSGSRLLLLQMYMCTAFPTVHLTVVVGGGGCYYYYYYYQSINSCGTLMDA